MVQFFTLKLVLAVITLAVRSPDTVTAPLEGMRIFSAPTPLAPMPPVEKMMPPSQELITKKAVLAPGSAIKVTLGLAAPGAELRRNARGSGERISAWKVSLGAVVWPTLNLEAVEVGKMTPLVPVFQESAKAGDATAMNARVAAKVRIFFWEFRPNMGGRPFMGEESWKIYAV